MASYGTLTKSLSGGTYQFYIYYEVLSQDYKTAQSKVYVSWGLKKIAPNSSSYNQSGTATLYAAYESTVTKDGAVYFDMRSASVGSERSLYNTTITLSHDSSGKKRLYLYGYLSTGISLGSAEISSYVDIPDIPMASTASATDAYIEGVSAVTITQMATSYTHSVAVSFGSISGWLDSAGNIVATEVKMSATSIPFTLPEDFYYEIPNAASGKVMLTVTTYSGNTVIGETATTNFTASCDPVKCAPSCSLSLQDVDATAVSLSGKSAIIRYLSDVELTLTSEAKYGASIAVENVMGTTLTEDIRTVTVADTTTNSFSATVTDSRGFKTSCLVASGRFVEYFPPTITAMATREAETSGNVNLSVTGKFFAAQFGSSVAKLNTLAVSYRTRQYGGEWSDSVSLATYSILSGNEFTISSTIENLDYRYTYEVEITAADKAVSTAMAVVVPRGIPVYDWGENDVRFNVPVRMMTPLAVSEGGTGVKTTEELKSSMELVSYVAQDLTDAQKAQARENIGAARGAVVLWENASPTSSFGAQNMTLEGLDECYMYSLICNTYNGYQIGIIFYKDGDNDIWAMVSYPYPSSGNLYIANRGIGMNPATGKAWFYDCTFGYWNSTGTDNSKLIPWRLIGFKN